MILVEIFYPQDGMSGVHAHTQLGDVQVDPAKDTVAFGSGLRGCDFVERPWTLNKALVAELRAVRDQLMKMSASSNAKAFNAELNGVTAELRNTKASVKQLKIVRDMLMTALQQPSASTFRQLNELLTIYPEPCSP